MKKIISVLLAVILICLCFAGCGNIGKTMTKEEMLEVAEKYSVDDIENDSQANIINAKEKYFNKVLHISGTAFIKDDHIEFSNGNQLRQKNYSVDVFLSKDELANIESGQLIEVVGKTTDKIIESSESSSFGETYCGHYQMKSAYIVEDRVTLEGELHGNDYDNPPAYRISVGNSDKIDLIYFAEEVNTSSLQRYNTVYKFTAKAIGGNPGSGYCKFKDAKIIN